MKKEFVPYDEALALKELGFDEPCFSCYYIDGTLMDSPNEDGTIYPGDNLFINHTNNYCEEGQSCSAPTYSQAFRWFRKEHDLVHRINRDGGWWECAILNLYDENDQGAIEIYIENCYPDTYEEAELECLKKLIELIK